MKVMRCGRRRVRALVSDLVARDRLGQEVRSVQIRAKDLVEAVLGRLEDIGADPRGAPGIVHQRGSPRRSDRELASTSRARSVAFAMSAEK